MLLLFAAHSWGGERFNFNAGWKVQMGKNPKASGTKFDDSQWQTVTLPWSYNQQEVHSDFQWNDKNFFCNYGGINKNVWLHVMGIDIDDVKTIIQ